MTRHLKKTISFGAIHLCVGFCVAYALTGSWAIAGALALIEPAVNTCAFLLHELWWSRAPQTTGSCAQG